MSDNVSVSKIHIRVGDRVIELTGDEARELKRVLDELFPGPTVPTIIVNPVAPIIYPAPALPWAPTWWPTWWCETTGPNLPAPNLQPTTTCQNTNAATNP